ncbi:hypothetical protein F0562_006850 [Nyssa sinensis]|uniref:Uncharacterized protein n=1 Tax=Nyssa sinensis TaxID=561372 RepID=A0A5J5AP81_9ASTE|nr:hypothetical protein F0562_006850 [Nyssa sinensis]
MVPRRQKQALQPLNTWNTKCDKMKEIVLKIQILLQPYIEIQHVYHRQLFQCPAQTHNTDKGLGRWGNNPILSCLFRWLVKAERKR